jgi:hypothetical protein
MADCLPEARGAKKAIMAPHSADAARKYKPASKLLVLSLIQPTTNGPTKPPRLPVALINAIAPAAAVPVRKSEIEHLHSRIGIAKTLSSPIPVVRAKPDQIAAISAKSFPVGSLQAGAMAWDTDKSRRYLRLAAENDKRAAATENARLKALFSKMAVQYRDLADQMDDPEIASVQAKQK